MSNSAGPPLARVLTLNTWLGDYRRGYASRDLQRLRWIEAQVRAVDADVLCLQEVMESDAQQWWESTFPDYAFELLHQTNNCLGRCVWLFFTLVPGAVVALTLQLTSALAPVPSLLAGCAVWIALEWALTMPGYPDWAVRTAIGGFPIFGSKSFFCSTNASLAIGVRREFGSVSSVQTSWFSDQGKWQNTTVAGTERELTHFNPDRYLNCLRRRGILALTVHLHSLPAGSPGVRIVNMHLNIGVENPVVRRAQLSQLIDEFLCPVAGADQPFILCGDTNACANKPEPEMAWCVLNRDLRPPQARDSDRYAARKAFLFRAMPCLFGGLVESSTKPSACLLP
eukprot:COSAG02_NODE_19_length_53976_cov_37.338512_32_plen_340_part_00